MTEKAATVFTCVGSNVHYYWSDIIILIIDHKLIPEFDFYFKHFAMNISKHYTLFNLIIIFLKVNLQKLNPVLTFCLKRKPIFTSENGKAVTLANVCGTLNISSLCSHMFFFVYGLYACMLFATQKGSRKTGSTLLCFTVIQSLPGMPTFELFPSNFFTVILFTC